MTSHRENYKVALGGGVADAFHFGRTSKFVPTTDHICGMAVSGPNIRAASVVIPASVENPKHLGRYMQRVGGGGSDLWYLLFAYLYSITEPTVSVNILPHILLSTAGISTNVITACYI